MFEPVFRRPKEAPYSAFGGMENENDEDEDEDDSHFDIHSSDSTSRMEPVEDKDVDFLQLRVDDSLSGPERVQVFQVSMKELELGKSVFCVDSGSQLARSSTNKESRQIEILRTSEDSQLMNDTWSIHSVSTISGMASLFDPVDENMHGSATRPSTGGANVASSSTNIAKDEKQSRFKVLPCCLWNGDKSPTSRSGERRQRRAAWFGQLPLVAKIGVIVFVVLFVVSIVTIIVSVVDNNDEPDPSSTGSVEISATSPTDLYTATPVASFTDSPTSSPVSIPTASPTTTNNLWTATPVVSLTDSPTSSPVSIPTASPTTSNNLVSTSTPVAPLTDSPTSSPVSIPTPSPTTTKNLSTATSVASLTDSPTNSPLSIPTASPTTTKTNFPLGVICVDDTVATFAVSGVTRDCAWLSESLALQVLLCKPGQGAFEVCRETCNNCPT
jgi:hypothetical protein